MGPRFFNLLAKCVLRNGFEHEKPHADGTISIFKAGDNHAMFHLCHLRADLHHQVVDRAGIPYRVPDPAESFTGRSWPEHVGRASGRTDHRARFENVSLVIAHAETDST